MPKSDRMEWMNELAIYLFHQMKKLKWEQNLSVKSLHTSLMRYKTNLPLFFEILICILFILLIISKRMEFNIQQYLANSWHNFCFKLAVFPTVIFEEKIFQLFCPLCNISPVCLLVSQLILFLLTLSSNEMKISLLTVVDKKLLL